MGLGRASLRVALATVLLGASLLAAACGSAADEPEVRGTSGGERDVTLTVAAATSLAGALEEIGEGFRATRPGVEVTFTFDSSSAVARQIREGAPVDVFASADEISMTNLVDDGLIAGDPAIFARNELVIVTRPGNPTDIDSLADLSDAGVIALCGQDAPCGRYAAVALDGAGVVLDESKVTRGQNVRATLAAVVHGDAVAGIVYVTDALGAEDAVAAVAIPPDLNVVATYSIALAEDAGDARTAEAFVAYVRGDEAQAVLAAHGFLPPT